MRLPEMTGGRQPSCAIHGSRAGGATRANQSAPSGSLVPGLRSPSQLSTTISPSTRTMCVAFQVLRCESNSGKSSADATAGASTRATRFMT
jgi:hypothetical protein